MPKETYFLELVEVVLSVVLKPHPATFAPCVVEIEFVAIYISYIYIHI
jgi:hypothetical protein